MRMIRAEGGLEDLQCVVDEVRGFVGSAHIHQQSAKIVCGQGRV
jgi:hypothetical protein